MSEMTNEKVMSIFDKTYEIALNGLPTSKSISDLAEEYRSKYNDILIASIKLRDYQVMKCGTSGFLTGLGGIIILPVALPANITSVIYVQMRMVAAIAEMGGYDVNSDQVQSLVYLCLTGNGMKDIAKAAGISFGGKFTTAMIKKIPGTVMTKVNQKVGFRFITKFGTKGVVNLGKAVPIVGGVIGAGFDIASTKIIANNAINLFIKGEIE
jgi:hypothetical protein